MLSTVKKRTNLRESRVKFCFVFLSLSACALPQVDPLDIPADVSQFIPADIDMSEVNRDTEGCYFYTYAGSLFTVTDNNGDPVCVPDTAAANL